MKSFIPIPKSLPPIWLALRTIFTIEAGKNVLLKTFGDIPVLKEALLNSALISSVTSIVDQETPSLLVKILMDSRRPKEFLELHLNKA